MDYNIFVNVKIKSVIQTNYELKQQDYGQKLIVSAEDYDINGTTARLFINKIDGTVNERIMTKENDSYTYILDADDTSCAGKTVFDVKYYKQDVRDSSASFIFNIIPDRFGNLIESKTISDSLQSALDRVDRTIEIVDEYDEKIEQINKASGRAENAATNSVIAVANCEQATNKANVATDRANTAAATAEGIAENKTGINDNAVGASTTWSSNKINTSLGNQIGTVTGSSINLPNTFNGGLLLKELQGKSIQNGVPSPANKVDIVSVGDDGSVIARVTGNNLLQNNAVTSISGGVTFTVNSDKSITATGTRTGSSTLGLQGDGQNVVSVFRKGVKYKSFNQSLGYKDTDGNFGIIPVAGLTPTKDIKVTYVYAEIWASYVLPLTIYPMLYIGEATNYEPYKEQLITIPLTQPLRSVGSVYDRGCVKSGGLWGNERKFGCEIFDGSDDEGWSVQTTDTTGVYRIKSTKTLNISKKLANPEIVPNILCDRYSVTSSGATWRKTKGISTTTTGEVVIYDDTFTTNDISLYKTWLKTNPITVVYELETPVIEQYAQAIQDQLNKLQTYQGVTNVFTTDALQPNMIVEYGKTDTSALSLYANNIYDNKIDKSKVTNSLAVTEEGFVADPRAIKTINDKVDVLNNNLGYELSAGVVGGNTFVIKANIRQSICEWIGLAPGTYLINAKAMAHTSTEYFIRNTTTNTILKACNDTGSIIFMITTSEELVLDFCAMPTTDYTIYADGRYNYLQAIRLK